MSTNVSVIQKLEGLLARVTRRAAEPRQVDRHEAPTTVPPPMEAVSIAQPLPYTAPPPAELELVPVEESEADAHLPVVEAVAAPSLPAAAAEAAPSAPVESIAVATPEPVFELTVPRTVGYEQAPVAPADAVARVAAEAAAITNDVQTAPPPEPAAAAEELAPISEPVPTPVPTGDPPPVVVSPPPSVAAPPMHVIADADTADGSVPVVVDVPVVREVRMTPPPPAPEPAESAPAAAATKALDGSHTQPPPPPTADEATVVAVPVSPPVAVVEVPPAPATSEVQVPAALPEEAVPSSSRRVRTVPPGEGTALTHESGAHVIPERPAGPGELSLSVRGTVYARAPLPEGVEVAVFASAASAPAPVTFGGLLDDSFSLGELALRRAKISD